MDDPAHLPARARAHREDGPAAALGDEVLLEMLAEVGTAREAAELLRHPVPAVAQLPPEPPKERRGRVAQVRAVVLHAPRDALRQGREAGLHGLSQLVEERRRLGLLVQRRPGPERRGDRDRDVPQRARVEPSAERGMGRRVADVLDAVQVGLVGAVEERDRLRREGLASRDLAGVRRGRERAGEVGSDRRGGRVRKPRRNRRELEHGERVPVHAASVGRLLHAAGSSRPPRTARPQQARSATAHTPPKGGGGWRVRPRTRDGVPIVC